MSKVGLLKAELWKRFGSRETPAEWDGHVYGGGKLSQRFWEYFKAIELLEPDADSVIIDIGGGSPVTGAGFFASLLSTVVKKVIVFDQSIAPAAIPPANIEFVRSHASYEILKSFLQTRPEVTHVTSISVFEHIPPPIREDIVRAINDFFHGNIFVATLEFHSKRTFFEHQLTAQTLSSLFAPFTSFYLDAFESSPVWCENAYDSQRLLKSGGQADSVLLDIPRWYPIATRFLRFNR